MSLNSFTPADLSSCTLYASEYQNYINLDQDVSTILDLDTNNISLYEIVNVECAEDLEKISDFTKSVYLRTSARLNYLRCMENITAPNLVSITFDELDTDQILDILQIIENSFKNVVRLCMLCSEFISVIFDHKDGNSNLSILERVDTVSLNNLNDASIDLLSNFPNLYYVDVTQIDTGDFMVLQEVVPNFTHLSVGDIENLSLCDVDTSKLQMLHIHDSYADLTRDNVNLCEFPSLRILSVMLDGYHPNIGELVAPMLEELSISSTNGTDYILPKSITKNLKKIILDEYKHSIADLHLVNAEHITLRDCTGSICIDRTGERVNYSKLKTLNVFDCDDSIQCIDAPILENLTIKTKQNDLNGLFLAKLDNLLTLRVVVRGDIKILLEKPVCFPLLDTFRVHCLEKFLDYHLIELPSLRVLDISTSTGKCCQLDCWGKLHSINLGVSTESTFVKPSKVTYNIGKGKDYKLLTCTFRNNAKSAYK